MLQSLQEMTLAQVVLNELDLNWDDEVPTKVTKEAPPTEEDDDGQPTLLMPRKELKMLKEKCQREG